MTTLQDNGLSRRALLVSVNVSQWVGRKLDRKATQEVNSSNKASSGAGSYTKKLLPSAKELDKVSAMVSKARQFFYENTLPWMSDGTRIISAKNYLNFTNEIRKIKSDFESAVSEFSLAYPKLRVEAQARLGDLYNPQDYPQSIEDKFSFEVNYLPLPDVKDFRIDVSEAEKNEFKRKILEVEQRAMQDVWSRLHSVIKNASEKLSKPDTVFRDSLLENITGLTSILPMLNISEDPKLEEITKEVNNLVNSLSADTLRENKHERQDAANRLSELEKNLSGYLGVR